MKSKAIALSIVSVFCMLALAGCQTDSTTKTTETTTPATTTTTTVTPESTTTTKPETTTKTTETTTTPAAAGEISTPNTAKNKTNTAVGDNKVVTYTVEGTVDASCEAQAKMVTEAGWKASSTMPSPMKAANTWTQIFENGKMMTTLNCAEDPTTKGATFVSLSQSANMMMAQ